MSFKENAYAYGVTKTILVILFCIGWLGVNLYEQIRFASKPDREVVEHVGDYVQFIVPAAGLTGSLITGDLVGAGQFALGCITNAGVTTILKQGINAPRPNGEDHSFPSGHTAFAFQGAAFIQRRYGWRLGILAYLMAGFVGYARVDSDMHWVRDVVAGAVIGTACSYIFTRPLNGKKSL